VSCGGYSVSYVVDEADRVELCGARMSYQDFVKNYQKLEICNLSADSLTDASSTDKRWEMTVNDGCWKKRVNAGGCRNYLGMQSPCTITLSVALSVGRMT